MTTGPRSRSAATSIAALLFLGVVSRSLGCGYDWTVVPRGSTKTDCRSRADCARDEYCVFPDARCGQGVAGACAPIVASSTCDAAKNEPVCTCDDTTADGTTAENQCLASSRGLDVAREKTCPVTLPGVFRCGFRLCPQTQFCLIVEGAERIEYRCVPWTCAERTCTCKEDLANACAKKPTCETAAKLGTTTVRCPE